MAVDNYDRVISVLFLAMYRVLGFHYSADGHLSFMSLSLF